MVRQSGASILFVSGHLDNTQRRTVFYRTNIMGGKDMQCPAASFCILCSHGPVEKLRQDLLDSISVYFLRSVSDSALIPFRAVHHCSGYVSDSGND